ncbi:NAD(P)H-dependent oxidoreductase [Amycolatopsis ultiminotia]|uniref:NAD(P)H-dependent oxidoreductase n=1 Tax=Amycolatopsis ultiminotia TaxID=543629 RepID=A0ABP6XH62_9PSEU
MSEAPVRLAVLVGSVREGRFAPTVARWFAREVHRHGGFAADVIDLADVDLPLAMSGSAPHAGPLATRLSEADGFVVITPEYNHSYPAALKNVVDWFHPQWQAKPVAFVSYGGLSGGLRAVEHLRAVFAELHAVTIRDTVSFHGAHVRFDEDGAPVDTAATETAAKVLLDQVEWWARALRDARTVRAYPA